MSHPLYYLLIVATLVRLDAFHCAEASTSDLLNRRELPKEQQPPHVTQQPSILDGKLAAITQQVQSKESNLPLQPPQQHKQQQPAINLQQQQTSPLPQIQPEQNPLLDVKLNDDPIRQDEPPRARPVESGPFLGAMRRKPRLINRQNEKRPVSNSAFMVAEARSYEIVDESVSWEPHDDKETHPIYNMPFSSHNDLNPNEDLNSKINEINLTEDKLLDEEEPIESITTTEMSEKSSTEVPVTSGSVTRDSASEAKLEDNKNIDPESDANEVSLDHEASRISSHLRGSPILSIDVAPVINKTTTHDTPKNSDNETLDRAELSSEPKLDIPEDAKSSSIKSKLDVSSEAKTPEIITQVPITQISPLNAEPAINQPKQRTQQSTLASDTDSFSETTTAHVANLPTLISESETITQMTTATTTTTTTTTQPSMPELVSESSATTTPASPTEITPEATSFLLVETENLRPKLDETTGLEVLKESTSTTMVPTTASPVEEPRTEQPDMKTVPHHSRLHQEDIDKELDFVDEDEGEPFNIMDYIPVYEMKEGEIQLMILYVVFCVATLTCITFFKGLLTGVSGPYLDKAPVPETLELKQKVEAKRQSLEKEKENLNLESSLNLQEHQKQLTERKVRLAKLLEEKKKLAPLKRDLEELKAKLGNNADLKISAKKEYLECLKRYKKLDEESERVLKELKEKTRRAKHEQLIMITNFIKLEDLHDLMRGMEFKQKSLAHENSTLALKVEADLITDIIELRKSCNRQLAEQYESLQQQFDILKKDELKLANELEELRIEREKLESDESIDEFRKKVGDLLVQADKHYKEYMAGYHKLKLLQ